MLTENQERYLLKIPEDKLASVKKFNPVSRVVADNIIQKLRGGGVDAKLNTADR